jgi:hypothetical protein
MLSGDIISVGGAQYELLSKGSGKTVVFSKPIPVGRRIVSTRENPVYLYPTPENPKGIKQSPGEFVLWDQGRISSLPAGSRARLESGKVVILGEDGKWTSSGTTAAKPAAQPAPKGAIQSTAQPGTGPAAPGPAAPEPPTPPAAAAPPPEQFIDARLPVEAIQTGVYKMPPPTETVPPPASEIPMWVWILGAAGGAYILASRK